MVHPSPEPPRGVPPARRPHRDGEWAASGGEGTRWTVRFHDRVGSTNDELRLLAQAGAAHGTVVAAAEQTAGRGRLGRAWHSPPGNLYASVLLRTEMVARQAAELGFVAALAVADAVEATLPAGAGPVLLKWPNDVLLDGAKVAGILLERLDCASGRKGSGAAVVAGIGVNVAHAPQGLPYAATCLARHAGTARSPVPEVLDAVLAALAARWAEWRRDGFAPVRAAWLRRGPAPGAPLRVSAPGGPVRGGFVGLDGDGALLLQVDGATRRFVSGDVVPLHPAAARDEA